MNECFICLETFEHENCENSQTKILKCCKNKIHNKCLVHLFLYNHDNCPLCRSYLDVYSYLSKKDFSNVIFHSDTFSISFSPKITEFYINYNFKKYFVILSYIYTVIFFVIIMYLFFF